MSMCDPIFRPLPLGQSHVLRRTLLGGKALDHSAAGAVPVIATNHFMLLYPIAYDIQYLDLLVIPSHRGSPTSCVRLIAW